MQPSPSAETSRLLFPSFRFCTVSPPMLCFSLEPQTTTFSPENPPGGHVRKPLMLSLNVLYASAVWSQSPPAQSKLSVHWEELTAADFKDAIARAQGTCLLPFGIMEKHGPHLPLGNDLLNVRYVALTAAQQEYAVVFPEYYFGQIFEAKHEPGTVAYSRGLQLPEGLYTGIWWYARFPNHYAGEGAVASRELGEFEAKTWINGIVQAIRAVKADQESLRLQNEFYERSRHPLDTPQ